MVKQSPHTISQTARSPEKLLPLRERLNSRKRAMEKNKKKTTKKTHKTREEVKLTDTQLFKLDNMTLSSISRQTENSNGRLQNWAFMGVRCSCSASLSNRNRDRMPMFPSLKSSSCLGSADDAPEFRGRQGFTHTTCPLNYISSRSIG